MGRRSKNVSVVLEFKKKKNKKYDGSEISKKGFRLSNPKGLRNWLSWKNQILEGNYRNYVIDKLTYEIMENKPLGSRL